MKIKRLVITLLILGAFTAIVAYKMYHKPPINVAEEKAAITLTASKLLRDFSSDETLANTTYLDKIIQVNGIVAKVENEVQNSIITLETNDDFGSIICHLIPEKAKKTSIKVGQEITLKGICTGFLMDVILVKGSIVNP